MTTPIDSQQLESYVPVFDDLPNTWDAARPILVEHLKKISNGLNDREIGFFLDEELLSGKAFFPSATVVPGNPQQMRQILRKVIDFGTLPNAGTKSVAHGITFDINFSLMTLYFAATDPVNFLAFGLEYWSQNPAEDIILNMDVTNVNVKTTANYSTYTRCYVVIEYIQEI